MTGHEAETLAAVHARLIPSDEYGPGAAEAQVLRFVEGALAGRLAGVRERYAAGLEALDAWAASTRGDAFPALPGETQDEVLRELESGAAPGFEPSSRAFFDLVRLHAIQGMFSDPKHGGNAGEAGWELIGFPGLRHGYGEEEQQLDVVVPRAAAGSDLARQRRPSRSVIARSDPTEAARRLDPVDVAVVGLGAAGGIAAARLALAGLRVAGLEAGPRVSGPDFGFDELGNQYWNDLGEKINGEIPTWRPADSAEATAAREGRIVSLMVNGVGGGTIHYAGAHHRLAPWHFALVSSTRARYGTSALPPGSTAADWPVGYDELAPFYEAVEQEIGVSGQAGANPFEGPRGLGYPLPPLRRTGWTELVAGAARDGGLHPFATPAAILSEPFRGQQACTYCGFCNYHGCHVDAKSSTYMNVIPKAQATGNLTVAAGGRVVELPVDGQGRVAGATYLVDGRLTFQPARAVFLAAHSLESTRLLFLSRSPAFPNGLANNAGQVGRNAMSHLYVTVDGLFPGRKLNRFGGTWPQSTGLDDFNADNFDHSGLGFVGGGCIHAVPEAKPIGTALSTPPSVPRWGPEWKAWLARNGNSVGRMVATAESLPYEDSFIDLDPTHADPLGLPVLRMTYRLHEQEERRYAFLYERMDELFRAAGASETWAGQPRLPAAPFPSIFGATRMGDDPASSVLDRWCASHEVPNLVVVAASSFPTSGGYPPTPTIQALAWRAADRLAQALSGNPR